MSSKCESETKLKRIQTNESRIAFKVCDLLSDKGYYGEDAIKVLRKAEKMITILESQEFLTIGYKLPENC
jgi:hypothetical protein